MQTSKIKVKSITIWIGSTICFFISIFIVMSISI
ncbi:putative membrane protein, partial [Escherichia coli CB7326]